VQKAGFSRKMEKAKMDKRSPSYKFDQTCGSPGNDRMFSRGCFGSGLSLGKTRCPTLYRYSKYSLRVVPPHNTAASSNERLHGKWQEN
jgi:hypothetical protein